MTTKQLGAYNLRFIWTICLVAAMGGLLFGYDWVVIGGAKPFYEPYFGISGDAFYQGLAINSALIGCLFGAAIAGTSERSLWAQTAADTGRHAFHRFGHRHGVGWRFHHLQYRRWIGGLGIGLASNLSPMYIAEISPAECVENSFRSSN